MHIQFLEYLVDPVTHQNLYLEDASRSGDVIESGFLICSNARYPIVQGIPRFVSSSNYSASFGWQWKKWSRVQFDSENIGRPMEGHTTRMWEQITACQKRNISLAGKTIVDIGCGAGRFVDVTRAKGARVIALDYSDAVQAAQANFRNDPDVCVIQGDALQLPIRSASADGAYTIGVLHHTPAPEIGVREAYRILDSGGWCAVSVYGKGGYYDFPSVQAWRGLFKHLWRFFGPYPPLAYAYIAVTLLWPVGRLFPLLGKASRLVFPFVNLPDRTWSLLDTFDSVTPAYQTAHESHEVFRWLKTAGFSDIEPSNWGFTSYSAQKLSA